MNKRNKLSFIGAFSLASVWFGAHVGGGFASGSQTMSFFIRYGRYASLFAVISMVLVGLTYRENMIMARHYEAYDYHSFGKALFEPYNKVLSPIYDICYIMAGLLAVSALDIGGQDVKAISIDETGRIIEFYMNDKCAAGTGRFLEVMAGILECPINQLGELDALSKRPVTVSSTCTVFAESEVISLLSQNLKKEDIARGIHLSIISRAVGLLYRTRMEDDFSMTGGVAKNRGVVTSLESTINKKIYVSEYAQLMGAVGAALFAVEMEMER